MKVAMGVYSNPKREAILSNVGDLLNNNTFDIVQEVLELMELTGASEDDCIGFESWDLKWLGNLLAKLQDHDKVAVIGAHCDKQVIANETLEPVVQKPHGEEREQQL